MSSPGSSNKPVGERAARDVAVLLVERSTPGDNDLNQLAASAATTPLTLD